MWNEILDYGVVCGADIKSGFQGGISGGYQCIIGMNQTHSSDIVYIQDNLNAKQWGTDIEAPLIPFDEPKDHIRMEFGLNPIGSRNNVSTMQWSNPEDVRRFRVNADAMVTTSSAVVLSVRGADCLPIIFVSDGLLAVAHAGRVGTLSGISKQVCLGMKALGAQQLFVWFGPACNLCCYEIHKETGTHYDLRLENREQIESVFPDVWIDNCGGKPSCTLCNQNQYYSYRGGDIKDRNEIYVKIL